MKQNLNAGFGNYDYNESNYVYTVGEARQDWMKHVHRHIIEAKEEIIKNDNENTAKIIKNNNENTAQIIANDNAIKAAIVENDNKNTKSIIDTIKNWWNNKPSWWNA